MKFFPYIDTNKGLRKESNDSIIGGYSTTSPITFSYYGKDNNPKGGGGFSNIEMWSMVLDWAVDTISLGHYTMGDYYPSNEYSIETGKTSSSIVGTGKTITATMGLVFCDGSPSTRTNAIVKLYQNNALISTNNLSTPLVLASCYANPLILPTYESSSFTDLDITAGDTFKVEWIEYFN